MNKTKRNMKKTTLLSLLALIMLASACHDDDGGPDLTMARSGQLSSVVLSAVSTPDEFTETILPASSFDNPVFRAIRPYVTPMLNARIRQQSKALDKLFLDEVGASARGKDNWQIETWVFTYYSLTSRGEKALLSGTVYFPNNTADGVDHELSSLTIEALGAAIQSGKENEIKAHHVAMRTFLNTAVIVPDFQGMGYFAGKDVFCYASSTILARQMADCAMAAIELMRQRGVTLAPDGYTQCLGSSQGVAAVMSFAKYYDTEAPQWLRDELKLKSTLLSCGTSDLAGLLRYLSDHPDFDANLSKSVVVSMAALTPQQTGGYQPEEFMADAFHDTQVTLNGEQMSYYEALAKYQYNVLGTEKDMPESRQLSEVMAADMLTADGKMDPASKKTQALLQTLSEQNDIYHWTPVTPLYMVHCPQDNAIPYDAVRKVYEVLSANGTNPNVHWADSNMPLLPRKLLGSIRGGIHAASATLVQLKMWTVENPKDLMDKWEH